MPISAVTGTLLQCDPPQMAMVRMLNASTPKYIIAEIDERTCVVKTEHVAELKAEVGRIMNEAMGLNLVEGFNADETDSDMDEVKKRKK